MKDAPSAGAGDRTNARPRPAVHPWVVTAAAYAWRLLAIGLLVVGVLWVAGKLLVVLVPLAVAGLLTRALWPVAAWLRRRGMRGGTAAAITLFGFLVAVLAVIGLVAWAVAGEVEDVGPTLSAGLDDVEDWLVRESPFDVTRAEVERWRDQAGAAVAAFIRSGGGDSAEARAVLAGEVILGTLLALVVTFFFLKDGRRFVERAVQVMPDGRRDLALRAVQRGWQAAGGYLRGAALLGLVESVVIGVALIAVGAELAAPVMLITFIAAFVPIVGAVAAGVVAVLVALVTAGTGPALIVALVALVVQQIDNEVMAPVVYGHAVRLHPLVVLLGIAAGGALFGLVGTVFAVPTLAVTLNVIDECRRPSPSG